MKKLLASVASAIALMGMAAPAVAANRPGYDSVTLSTIPSNAQVVAGYVGGMWPTYDAVVRDFPHAYHVSIAINASELTHDGKPVNCLDIEPGDAQIGQARAWDVAEIRLGEAHPCDYTSLSSMGALRVATHGLAVVYWVAAYDGNPALIGYDAHQWTDHALGRNLDGDTFSDHFLQSLGLEAHVATIVVIGGVEHYEDYPANYWRLDGQRMRERNTVMTWDARGCRNEVKRPVCKSTRAHLALLLSRDQAVYKRDTSKARLANHLPGRIQGLVARLKAKRPVSRWL